MIEGITMVIVGVLLALLAVFKMVLNLDKIETGRDVLLLVMIISSIILTTLGMGIVISEQIIYDNNLRDRVENMNCHDLGDLVIKNKVVGNSTTIPLDRFNSLGCKFDVSTDIVDGLK